MKYIRKKSINPKTAFSLLSVVLFMLITLSIPLAGMLAENEFIELTSLLPGQYILWAGIGVVAGSFVAILGIYRLNESVLIRIIRIFLVLIIVFIVAIYIALRTAEY